MIHILPCHKLLWDPDTTWPLAAWFPHTPFHTCCHARDSSHADLSACLGLHSEQFIQEKTLVSNVNIVMFFSGGESDYITTADNAVLSVRKPVASSLSPYSYELAPLWELTLLFQPRLLILPPCPNTAASTCGALHPSGSYSSLCPFWEDPELCS